MLRVFQIGFNRCGTDTLYRVFAESGVPSIHWDHGRLAQQIYANLSQGAPPVDGFLQVAFFDMEWVRGGLEAFKLFPKFYAAYPDAVFILNTRTRERWLESRLSHANGEYARLYQATAQLPSRDALVRYWRDDWDRHHANVRAFFAGRGRMFEFNIEQEAPEKIVQAIPELRLDAKHYRPSRNKARSLLPVDARLARKMFGT